MKFSLTGVLLFLIAVSVLIGVSIPAFYDWTGSDQSRPSPLIMPIATGILCALLACWITLPWWPLKADSTRDRQPFQFGIRGILVATAVTGIVLCALTTPAKHGVSIASLVASLGYAAWLGKTDRSMRLRLIGVVACLYGPYLWALTGDQVKLSVLEILHFGSSLPSLFWTLMIGSTIGSHPQNLIWLGTLLTSALIFLGAVCSRFGSKTTVAYLVFALVASIYGSFILNALVRI